MIELGHVYCFRIISKISQATGLRDPEYGCSLSPFNSLEAGRSGNHGEVHTSPVSCGAMAVIEVSTLPNRGG